MNGKTKIVASVAVLALAVSAFAGVAYAAYQGSLISDSLGAQDFTTKYITVDGEGSYTTAFSYDTAGFTVNFDTEKTLGGDTVYTLVDGQSSVACKVGQVIVKSDSTDAVTASLSGSANYTGSLATGISSLSIELRNNNTAATSGSITSAGTTYDVYVVVALDTTQAFTAEQVAALATPAMTITVTASVA